jgi:hypothetical protein
MASRPRSFGQFLRDDSMSVALFGLFAVCIAAQSVSGSLAYDASLRQGGFRPIGWVGYLTTGDFLDGVFANWQAAILQLAVLVAFSSVLHQQGAAHSKKEEAGGSEADPRTFNFRFQRRESLGRWLYANSLSLTLFADFVVIFVLHAIFGLRRQNELLMLRHLPPVKAGSYLASGDFWVSVFQTWEAEFFAIGLYIVMSIFLRQESSPESKPVGSSNAHTGDPQE